MKFDTVQEVKSFIKSGGFDHPIRARKMHNPFGGDDMFFVYPTDLPPKVCVAVSANSREKRFFSDDGGKSAGLLNDLQALLQNTNATVGSVRS